MTSKLSAHFKSARAGVALFGVIAALSLSACTPPVAPDGLDGKPTESASATQSSTPRPVDGMTGRPTEEPTEDTGMDFTITYDRPSANDETSVGEAVPDAEARYVAAVQKHTDSTETDAELLDIGYATCGFMLGSNTETELFDKITEAYGTGDTEVTAIVASGAASKTLCPEFATFGE